MPADATPFAGLRADPSAALVVTFRAAAARMQGLTFVNPALAVEAVRIAPWQDHWLGVLVTPWFMNLVLAPRDPAQWKPLRIGAKRMHAFPAGDFEFIGAHDPACGEFAMCSLFSPVLEFADQAQAREVAELALAALFDPRNAEDASAASDAPTSEPASSLAARAAAPMSRRELLRGRFLTREP